MFNVLQSIHQLFFLTLYSFFTIFTIRQLFIKRKILVFLYHLVLFGILFTASIGGGGVQNDGYDNLEKFLLLEKNNQLEQAKKNLQDYDSSLQSHLQEFQNSNEFRDYLKRNDAHVDQAEAISIGWFLVLLSEISIVLTQLLRALQALLQKYLKFSFTTNGPKPQVS